jgi:hypothetical protein
MGHGDTNTQIGYWMEVWGDAYLSEARGSVLCLSAAHFDNVARCSQPVFHVPIYSKYTFLAAGLSKLRRNNASKVRKRGARVARVRIFGRRGRS